MTVNIATVLAWLYCVVVGRQGLGADLPSTSWQGDQIAPWSPILGGHEQRSPSIVMFPQNWGLGGLFYS